MVYSEKGVFKRYIRNRKDKDGNKKEVTQVGVSGLSVNSEFDDGEEIVVLRTSDFTEMENQIQSLEKQVNEFRLENETLQNANDNSSTESPKYTNRVITLQEEINNRNRLLMNTQNTINTIFTKTNNNYNELGTNVTTANEETKDNIISLISGLQNEVKTILDLAQELPNQVNGINSSIDKTKWFTWIRSKNKFKIVLDLDELQKLEAKLTEFTSTDIVQLANSVITPVEIPTNNLDELTTEDLDLTELYISIENDNTDNEITVTPEAVNNGNDN